jgi:pyridoxine kinase
VAAADGRGFPHHGKPVACPGFGKSDMNVLSIQSAVAYGHVGNAAAEFCLQRLGHEVWRIDTVRFSNHPGHGGVRGTVTQAAEITDLFEGIASHGWAAQCDAILSGYLGAADQGPVVAAISARVRAANPRVLWVLDPVIGDHGRIFVKPGIPEFIRDVALPDADIITPNLFELAWLSNRPVDDIDAAIVAGYALRAKMRNNGRRIVIATGIPTTTPDLATIAITPDEIHVVRSPRLETRVHGTGDSIAALFLGALLNGHDVARALEHAVAALHDVITATIAAGSRELLLVAAQDSLATPRVRFPAATRRA